MWLFVLLRHGAICDVLEKFTTACMITASGTDVVGSNKG